jgi:hypothetical protein
MIREYLPLRLRDYFWEKLHTVGNKPATNRKRFERYQKKRCTVRSNRDPAETMPYDLPPLPSYSYHMGAEQEEGGGDDEENTFDPASNDLWDLKCVFARNHIYADQAVEGHPLQLFPEDIEKVEAHMLWLYVFFANDEKERAIIKYYRDRCNFSDLNCLVDLDRITNREIADSIGFSESTVSRRLTKMRDRLRQKNCDPQPLQATA